MSNICTFDDYIKEWMKKYNLNNKENTINEYNSISLCSKTNAYHILQIQPKANIIVDKNNGLYIDEINEYSGKIYNLLEKSFEQKYDLVLTPEYSVPLEVIEKLINNDNLEKIKEGTLYCLCCIGITCGKFQEFIDKLKNRRFEVYINSWESLSQNRIVCCLLYITKVKFLNNHKKAFEKIFIIPQFKTRCMKDDNMTFEYDTLTCGDDVVLFGKESENQFLSIICADVFNYKLIAEIKQFLLNKKTIVFHPQLNIRPQNNNFRFTRDLLLDYADMDSVRVIALNWAKGTKFNIDGNLRDAITDSWSAIYTGFFTNSFDKYMNLLDENVDKGLNFAHDYQVSMFYFPSDEHMLDISMKAFNDQNAAEVVRNTKFLTINHFYEFNKLNLLEERQDLSKNMVDVFFWDNEKFGDFFHDDGHGTKKCNIYKLNKFVSLIYNSKIEKQFEMINNGNITSLTSKHYKSEYSKEKLYICKRIYNKIKNNEVTERYKSHATNFKFDVIISNEGFGYNVKYNVKEFGTQYCRIFYLKYFNLNDAEKLYNDIYKRNKNAAERVIIYYEDEEKIHIFENSIDTSILKGEIAQNNTSILGGTLS